MCRLFRSWQWGHLPQRVASTISLPARAGPALGMASLWILAWYCLLMYRSRVYPPPFISPSPGIAFRCRRSGVPRIYASAALLGEGFHFHAWWLCNSCNFLTFCRRTCFTHLPLKPPPPPQFIVSSQSCFQARQGRQPGSRRMGLAPAFFVIQISLRIRRTAPAIAAATSLHRHTTGMHLSPPAHPPKIAVALVNPMSASMPSTLFFRLRNRGHWL